MLRDVDGESEERRTLDAAEEEALAAVSSGLVAFVAPPEQAVIAHERDGEVTRAWTREGALRLAELLPPASAELATVLRERYQD